MSRGYRSIIVAVIGWLTLIAAGPPKPNGQQPNQSTPSQTERPQIPAPVEQRGEASDSDKPCKQGNDDRESDLCAQWKAADAAKSAADATWLFGAFGTVVGGLTLAAAWSAAKWARKAAEHTAESVIEAKRSADAAEEAMATTMSAYEMQIRPYVAITTVDEEDRLPFSRETILKFAVKNFGQVPATNVRLSLGDAVRPEPIGDFAVPIGEKFGDYGLIAPGDCREEKIHAKGLSPAEIANAASGAVKFLVRLRIDYTWPEGADFHDLTMILDDPSTNEWNLLDKRRRQNLAQRER
jgi:hypothetical protein